MRRAVGCVLFFLLLACVIESTAAEPVALAAGSRDQKCAPRIFSCTPGPWGTLEYVRITLEPPDHYATNSLSYVKGTHWFFKRFDRDQVLKTLSEYGFAESELEALRRCVWQQATNGTLVLPGERLVIDLRPIVRLKLYALLGQFEENGYYQTPFMFRPETLDERFARSGISEKSVALVKSLLYPKGPLMAFSDISAAMSQIADAQEKVRLIKVLSRKSTLMLRLKLNEGSDVASLLDYWGAGGRAKDLKPILESLTRVEGGWDMDVAHLLPPFARKRLYTYPTPSGEHSGPHDNCHWSSFNFFNDTPDDSFHAASRIQKAVDEEYDVVEGSKHFGDVVLVMDSSDSIQHSAVYVADDIVFTKTGARENQPWILMRMEDMLPLYASASQPLKVVTCRKKK